MEKIVFTNGCFDLIHEGHVNLLREARALGTRLIVGINSDRSVSAIKGESRPLVSQESRAAVLRELRSVDEVLIFEENTPEALIRKIKPDVLVKGGDWALERIVGADFVIGNGGKVFSIPFRKDISTSKIVSKIINSVEPAPPPRAAESCGARNSAGSLLKREVESCEYLLETQLPNIEAAAEILRTASASGGRVIFCAAENLETVRAASEIFKTRRFLSRETDAEKRPEILSVSAESFARNGECRAGDALVVFCGDGAADDSLISAVLKARRGAARTIAAGAAENKKVFALADACIALKNFGDIDSSLDFLQLARLWLLMSAAEIKN